ncbi:MAG: nucleotide exchange factor GrpE [Candidatus Pacebacteria bacterium]|nr:nucleotide exchange factor GrpE [Candidatus Paceibacterota bacterium]
MSDQPASPKSQKKQTKPSLATQDNGENNQELLTKLEALTQQVSQAHEREKRALADYQNLVRRTQEERLKLVRMAGQEIIEALLPALENLDRAAEQLDDEGLQLVIGQLWDQFKQFGLEKIEAEGKTFDLETMEVVDRVSDQGQKVIQVVSPGYKLKGEVIKHAKVILGKK